LPLTARAQYDAVCVTGRMTLAELVGPATTIDPATLPAGPE
jgi:hypothetical protein